ncbi:MAG: general secretion pathway protein GspB [Xanthomonadales bacterium]|nr:general secretion pathway protein GspB [Xanthomonadales bacterium]
MSYILDALKKAEQEHDIGAVPDLATPHETEPPETRNKPWLWVFVALLVVNVILAVILLKSRVAEEAVTKQPMPEPQPALVDSQPAQPVQPASATPIVERPAPKEQTSMAANRPARTAGEVVLLPEPVALPDPGSEPAAETQAGIFTDVTTTAGDASKVPSWFTLPQAFRNKLDLPRVDVHVYSDEPQKRFILVNLEKYREGETLASGLVLEEVLPDGMVMSYRGERFKVNK